jgi:predicted permease
VRLSRNDLRLAVRSFTRHKTFTTIAVLSLALAIALNTTMYGVIDALVDPIVDMRAPEQLYFLTIFGDNHGRVDNATRRALLASAPFYEAAASYQRAPFPAAVEYGLRFDQTSFAIVSPNLFSMLGVHPLVGRTFADADFTGGISPVVISERLWGTLFPRHESPIGANITIDGVKHPVIGVLQRASTMPGTAADCWLMPASSEALAQLPVNIVRLRDGVASEAVQPALDVLARRLAALSGESIKDVRYQIGAVVGRQFHADQFHFAFIAAIVAALRFHYALVAGVIAVLLIACANLANLQLARGIGRSRELALRAALGASRRDIIAQLLLESAVLAGAGLLVGLVFTYWGTDFLRSRIPQNISDFVTAPQTSWRVLVFAMIASVVCVIFVGLLPAIRVSRVDPNELLKAGAGTGANRNSRRQYGIMVIVEIGLSIALLSGAGIVVRTALRIHEVRIGYDIAPLSSTSVITEPLRDTVLRTGEWSNRVLSTVRSLPDVAEATTYRYRSMDNDAVTIVDPSGASIEIPAPMASYAVVTPSYLRTFGRAVIQGRDFLDGVPAVPEVIVDQSTAHALWPNSNAVGSLIKLGEFASRAPWVRVVGVVPTLDDVGSQLSPAQGPITYGTQVGPLFRTRLGAIYYLPAASDSTRVAGQRFSFTVVARAKRDPARMPIALKNAIHPLFPSAFVLSGSMEDALGITAQRVRHDFVARTFAAFAALALALAAIGIYGIVAHSVAERKRELGVRIALGASARNVIGTILREGNAVALAGVALGLYLTKDTVVWLHAFSADGDEYDVVLFATMAAVLFLVAVLAALVPALRATRIDPVESLRSE